jgi:hypothetical protein
MARNAPFEVVDLSGCSDLDLTISEVTREWRDNILNCDRSSEDVAVVETPRRS